MRLPSLTRLAAHLNTNTPTTLRQFRTMSGSIAEFVAAAVKAQPTLEGMNESDKVEIQKVEKETEGMVKDLRALNEKLTPLTYLCANNASTADISLYCHLHPTLINTPASQHPQQPSILRYFLQIQSLPPVQSAHRSLPNCFPSLSLDVSSLPAPPRQVMVPVKKEKKAKAPTQPGVNVAGAAGGVVAAVTAAASAAASNVADTVAGAVEAAKQAVAGVEGEESKDGKKKEKKERAPKESKPAAVKEEPKAPQPSMIDMRVGKVLDVKKHPDAESLYVEQIDVGEAEPRTVCSGLVKYMKEEDIMGQTIIVICNLKPVTMRGVKSYAMLLCASSKDGKDEGGIEFVLPPAGSQPGERIFFEGDKYENAQPESQLNPKKKIFETIQPAFTTLDNLEAAWVDPETKSVHRIRTKYGVCKSKSLVGASLS